MSVSLPSTSWKLPESSSAAFTHLTVHHLRLSAARAVDGLLGYIHRVLAKEIARGASYPHEAPEGEYSRQEYETYFWTDDVFVVVGHRDPATLKDSSEFSVSTVGVGVDEARGGRAWEECLVGFFYIKPNYPGRSSHICNGGIVFPSHHRGGG